MAKKLALLLLIALMLALPLRVLAGVAMACPMATAMAIQQDDIPAGHCQDMDMQHPDGDAGHAQNGCTLCADCCLGSVTLPAAGSLGDLGPMQPPLVSRFEPVHSGFQPEGPERPPRSTAL